VGQVCPVRSLSMSGKRSRKSRPGKASPRMTEGQRIELIAKAVGIPDEQVKRGGLEEGVVVDLDGSLGGKRMSMVTVIVNRGGTALERWMSQDRRKPTAERLFGAHEERAIRYCQNLWARADGGLSAVDPTADRVDAPLGWAQQEAMTELKRLAERVPRAFWDCYENVVRWDEEAGKAGSRLANNSRSAVDAAKLTVAYTASLIAMWRRL
jgi:hypothetical protein